jgi:hypothetical protein
LETRHIDKCICRQNKQRAYNAATKWKLGYCDQVIRCQTRPGQFATLEKKDLLLPVLAALQTTRAKTYI